MRRVLGWTAAVLVLAAGVGLLARGGDGALTPAGDRSVRMGSGGGGDAGGAPAAVPSPYGGEGDFVSEDASGGDGLSGGPGVPDLAAIGPRVVKSASITVELKEGRFEEAYRKASLAATRYGGFIHSSSSASFDESRTATLVIRVAADQFDRALADLRELGEVRGEDVSGEDVSAQFVDLEARLRNWEAQEAVLLRLMSEAATIDESIKVQRNLQEVQLEIERLRGQLRLLRDQTDLATISLTLTEGDPEALYRQEEDERSTLAKAWDDAVGGFLNVVSATVVGLGYLIPIGMLAGLAWLLWRRFRPAPVTMEP
jgi:uncharacterized protein DUF4349